MVYSRDFDQAAPLYLYRGAVWSKSVRKQMQYRSVPK